MSAAMPVACRRRWLRAAVACAASGVLGPVLGSTAPPTERAEGADGFPRRPIALWVPWAPGGATDLTLRVLAELAGQRLGQRIVIQNRGGAGGTLAMPVLQQAAPDGYTLAQMPQTVFRARWTHPVTWDPVRDTTPILQVSGVTFGVVVPVGSPITSIASLLDWARAHPGQLSVATNGVGTTPHVVLDEWFAKLGLSYVHVPYKGVAEQMLGVASGQVMVGVGSNGFAPYVDTGRVRLLATLATKRSPRWKDVPTLHELGHGIVASSPYGIAGPKGVPPAVVQVLHDAFRSAMLDPLHLSELARYDQELAYLGPQDYGRAMQLALSHEQRTVERLGLAARQP
ncbi:MAG: hypothetical protein C0445_03935 [Polaromonas sp.]|nr:hypothetical protein [Polaromonas sp.]